MSEFDKIIGYTNEKEEMMRLCDVLKNKEKYIAFGVKIPKAVLLYGEPGLGKTLMAKAFITETGRKVFFCKKNKPDGEFVDKIKETFENAIKEAPSVIFFDDMDKFAEDNLQRNSNKEEFVSIQTGLEEIGDKDVFVIATANDTTYLPDSLMREGRFGRQIEFNNPSFEDSLKIIEHYMANKRISEEINAQSLVHIIGGSSCAVLESVINEAGIYAAYEGRSEIRYCDIKRAVSSVILKRYPLKELDNNLKWRLSYHEAGHAIIGLVNNVSVGCLAIGKCGQYGQDKGVCRLYDTSNSMSFEKSKYRIMSLLAGKASVEIQFNEVDLGAVKDLSSATDIIDDLMQRIAADGFEFFYPKEEYCNAQSYRQLDKLQEKRLRLIEEYYNNTKLLLLKNKELLDRLASELYEKEVLLYDEIMAIAGEYLH